MEFNLNLKLLSLYFTPYFIGLVFGFIYMILFVDLKIIHSIFSKFLSLFLFLILGLLYIFSYSLFIASIFGASSLSSMATNYIACIFMSIICFISSLYFFGYIDFIIPSSYKVQDLSKFRTPYYGFRILFLNFHFFWLTFNSCLLSIFYFQSSISVLMSFLGFFTAILFNIFYYRMQFLK